MDSSSYPLTASEAENNLNFLKTNLSNIQEILMKQYNRPVPSINQIVNLGMKIHIHPFTAEEHEILQPFHEYVRTTHSIIASVLDRTSIFSREIPMPNYRLTAEQQQNKNDLVAEAAIKAKEKYNLIIELFNEDETEILFNSIENNELRLFNIMTDFVKELEDPTLEAESDRVMMIGEITEMLLKQIQSETWQSVWKKINEHIDDIIANQNEFPIKIILSFV